MLMFSGFLSFIQVKPILLCSKRKDAIMLLMCDLDWKRMWMLVWLMLIMRRKKRCENSRQLAFRGSAISFFPIMVMGIWQERSSLEANITELLRDYYHSKARTMEYASVRPRNPRGK